MKTVSESPDLEPASPRGNVRIETAMGNLLRFGVLLAAAVVLIGGLLFLLRHGWQIPDYRAFIGETSRWNSLRQILSGAAAFEPEGIVQLGVLLLIATPVARVLYALFFFLRERDRRFVLITLIVAAVLLYGFLGGKA